MSKIINISDKVYPINDYIEDLKAQAHDIKDIISVALYNDGNAYVTHTGLPLKELALAGALIQYEIQNLINSTNEEII